MNLMTPTDAFQSGAMTPPSGGGDNMGSSQIINVKTYDIHEILQGDCPVTLSSLQYLIRCQASLHRAAEINDDPRRLREVLTKQQNTVRGFVLYGEGQGPMAYAIYYPAIDGNGEKVAYCEDFLIVEAYRGHGVARILFHELAKRTLDDGAKHLLWATDKRNSPVHDYVQGKLGAKHPNIITIAATDLLNSNNAAVLALKEGWASGNYATYPIKPNNIRHIQSIGLSPDLIRQTGDLEFKGFITFEKGTAGKVAAVVPGWPHFSTFQLKQGLHLEHPVFAEGMTDSQKQQIVLSVIDAAAKHANRQSYPYLRWHIAENEPGNVMNNLLQTRFGLQRDSMLGTPDSELIVYTLTNGNLEALAKRVPDRQLVISGTAPIGTRGVRPDAKFTPAGN